MASKHHPDDVKCTNCDGSGYDSAAKHAGWTKETLEFANPMHIPIGVWPCTSCNGTGLMIDGEKIEKMTEYLEEHSVLIQESLLAMKAKRKD